MRKRYYILIVLAMGLESFGSISESKTKSTLRFPPTLEVSHQAQYKLLDLVEIDNPNEELLRKLFAAKIPSSWTQGSRVSLNSGQIISILRETRIKQKNLEIVVPKLIQPIKSKEILSADHFKRVIGLMAKAECNSCDFKIDLHNIPKVLLSEWSWDPFSARFRGAFTTTIKMSKSKWVGWLTGYVKWTGPAIVTRKGFAYHEKINLEDLSESERDLTFTKNLPSTKDQVAGKIASRSLAASSLISFNDFQNEPLVKRGQVVKTLMDDANSDYEISIVTVAEETGVLGDTIRVKNVDSKKALMATIIERGVVRVK